MQSRAEVVPLGQGDGAFAVNHRPVCGTRGRTGSSYAME